MLYCSSEQVIFVRAEYLDIDEIAFFYEIGRGEDYLAVDIGRVHIGATRIAVGIIIIALGEHTQGFADHFVVLFAHYLILILHDDLGAAGFHIVVNLIFHLRGGSALLRGIFEAAEALELLLVDKLRQGLELAVALAGGSRR